jgi:hypothetical protein
MTANGLHRRVTGAREWTSYERLVTALTLIPPVPMKWGPA